MVVSQGFYHADKLKLSPDGRQIQRLHLNVAAFAQ
jgi:hypothetical protein